MFGTDAVTESLPPEGKNISKAKQATTRGRENVRLGKRAPSKGGATFQQRLQTQTTESSPKQAQSFPGRRNPTKIS